MKTNRELLKETIQVLTRALPVLSFVIPLVILYYIDPNSFQRTWQGRTFQLFFAWLCFIELIMNWEELKAKRISSVKSVRAIVFGASLASPTLYVLVANFLGVNAALFEWARNSGIGEHWAQLIPLSTEYLVFMALFVLIVVQEHGASGLKNYSIPALFLGVVGTLYTIDNLSPWGTFTPLQIMVPATTTLASNVLNLMGYQTTVYMTSGPEYGLIPNLRAQNSKGWAEFGIAWPCAGIESLLIYTVVVLIFLSKSNIPGRARVGYFVIGAIVTYFINILRIATIFVIAIDAGQNSAAVQEFHDYYGMLYSTIWIVSYPLIIMGSQLLWERMRKPTQEIQTSTSCSLPSQPSPA